MFPLTDNFGCAEHGGDCGAFYAARDAGETLYDLRVIGAGWRVEPYCDAEGRGWRIVAADGGRYAHLRGRS